MEEHTNRELKDIVDARPDSYTFPAKIIVGHSRGKSFIMDHPEVGKILERREEYNHLVLLAPKLGGRIMKENLVIQTMLAHKSIRIYSDKVPSDEVVETIVRAGQQAPFASQYYSVLLSRKAESNPWRAPLLFTICVDSHKFELIMAKRNWKLVSNDLTLLFFGIQDSALMAENMVVAGRSLGLGSCFLGSAMFRADRIAEEYELPERVFPLVQLAMGYPAEDPPTRPRYPIEFALFEGAYPDLDDEKIAKAMRTMDEGYLAQDYYRKLNAKIKLEGDRKETFTYADYSWTEHICRKWGQWYPDPKELLEQLEKRGFHITTPRPRLSVKTQ